MFLDFIASSIIKESDGRAYRKLDNIPKGNYFLMGGYNIVVDSKLIPNEIRYPHDVHMS